MIKTYVPLLAIVLLFMACKQPEARRPVSVKSGSFMRASIERNKGLLEYEESLIDSIIKIDSLNKYHSSSNGYSYYFITRDSTQSYLPKEGDVVKINYDIRTLAEDTIYSSQEIGIVDFKVDKEDYFPGLRTAVKLLKKGEKATFLFPSSLAYGYHGDDDKVGTNQTIKSTITLLDIDQKAIDSTNTTSKE
ncbi:gliding motility-associated peptidyl-prolyl isomerase GldI [Galbibacter orientalis]|uniref:Peptidyl-prolyl cis-trans isomerase n=1 Tax=Galbibacter orientalis DSM 19592 TaxID=926559 RepID=I3C6J6_9FLAO|nr:gliding motility-associated peptidyl-prolyl isomerase GldI [Galbibacter orientalis]EIJ39239.1 peptidyl-prolyl isomerase, gliding motility-associated [Galbibacter orientalis DSM 19592]